MNKEEAALLIVKGMGLYLLLNAFMELPDLITAISAIYAYGNILSSVSSLASSEGGQYDKMLSQLNDSYTSAYKNLFLGPVMRIVLFSAAGIYLLKGGGFLFRLLSREPNAEQPDADQLTLLHLTTHAGSTNINPDNPSIRP